MNWLTNNEVMLKKYLKKLKKNFNNFYDFTIIPMFGILPNNRIYQSKHWLSFFNFFRLVYPSCLRFLEKHSLRFAEN